MTPTEPKSIPDPNWPRWFYHADGRAVVCKSAREAEERCEGWSTAPLPPPAKIEPIPAEQVQAKVDEAVRTAVASAVAAERSKIETQRTEAREKYRILDQAFKDLDGKYGALQRSHAVLEKENASLRIDSTVKEAPGEPIDDNMNIFDTAVAARAAGPEEKY